MTQAATCQNTGVRTFTCTCGATKTETIPQLTHNPSSDWESNETKHWHSCTNSGCSEKLGLATHTWNTGEVTKAATYTEAGVRTYTCSICEHTKTEEIPKLEHTYSTEWSKDETSHWHACTDSGYESLSKDKAAHTWNNGQVTTEPTCEEKGEKTFTCIVCSATKKEEIPALEHAFDTNWSSDSTNHWHECTRSGCDEIQDDSMSEHQWDEGVVTKEPTVDEAGIKTYTCTVCKYTKTEPVLQGTDIVVSAGEPAVSDTTPNIQADSSNVTADSLKDAAKKIESEGLESEVSDNNLQSIIKSNNITAESARAALGSKATEDDTVKIIVDPYLNIEVKSYAETTTEKSLKLNIQALYTVKATTAASTDKMTEQNTATLVSGKKLSITGKITITIPLPAGFISSTSDSVFVQHKNYQYSTTITGSNNAFTATFVDPHGFSDFIVTTKSLAAAQIGEITYTSLQSAVDAVKNGETIKIVGASTENITVSKAIHFSVENTGNQFTGNITAGTGFDLATSKNGNTTTYTFTAKQTTANYNVTVSKTGSGTVTVTPQQAAKDTIITINTTPASGYKLDRLTVTASNGNSVSITNQGNGKYIFTMPESNVTVTAAFVKINSSAPSGSPSPSTPSASTIPVFGDEASADVPVKVSGSTVTIGEISHSTLQSILNSKQNETVEFDCSSLGAAIRSVELSIGNVQTIAQAANDPNSHVLGMAVRTTNAAVSFDAQSLQKIVSQANQHNIQLHIDNIGVDSLNQKQSDAVKSLQPVDAIDVYLTSNGQKISDFGDGNVYIRVPFTSPEGKNPNGFFAWYVPDDGSSLDRRPTSYDSKNKLLSFRVHHFSDYVIAYMEPNEILSCQQQSDCPIHPFTDANPEEWYHDGVHYVLSKGLMIGMEDKRFGPSVTVSRAMVAQILYANAKKPADTVSVSFSDVSTDAWYAKAVSWAQNTGVVAGYGDTTFRPDRAVTREELATMLYSAAAKPPVKTGTLNSYPDASSVSDWAQKAILWATQNGIITGDTSGTKIVLNPIKNATRAQLATMIMQYIEK